MADEGAYVVNSFGADEGVRAVVRVVNWRAAEEDAHAVNLHAADEGAFAVKLCAADEAACAVSWRVADEGARAPLAAPIPRISLVN